MTDDPARPDEPDEATVISRRGDGPAVPDEATVISRRRGVDPDATQPVHPDDLDTDTHPGPRRHADPSAGETLSDDGSTIVVRRKSRPRSPGGSQPTAAARSDADAASATSAVSATAAGAASPQRIAAQPEANATYPPRRPAQAEITRRAPSPRSPQAPVDTAAGETAARRRRRRTALIVVVAASVLVALAVAGIVALALIP